MLRALVLAALSCAACQHYTILTDVTPKADGSLVVEVCDLERFAGEVTISGCRTEHRAVKPGP